MTTGYTLGPLRRTTATMQYDIARFTGPVINGVNLMDYYALVYFDPVSGAAAPFAPTVRMKGGETMKHILINNMVTGLHNVNATGSVHAAVAAKIAAITNINGFDNVMSINLHAHGIYGSPGIFSQSLPIKYNGGDNILFAVPPRNNTSVKAKGIVYTNPIPNDHHPGMAYMHGHVHGGTAVNVGTASAIFIVEDNDKFLPDATGCKDMRTTLTYVPDRILHLTQTNLQLPGPIDTPTNRAKSVGQLLMDATTDPTILNAFLDFPNIQFMEEASLPAMTIGNGTSPQYPLVVNAKQDLILVNGGYLPRIRLPVNTWQRWRILQAGIQYVLSLGVVDSVANPVPVGNCTIKIFSKDGVYMPLIPRTVQTLILGSGNRVELLIKCSGTPGKTMVLASGYGPNPQGPLPGCDDTDPGCVFFKGFAATIELQAPDLTLNRFTPANITDEACTPLRANYVADMRNVPANQVVQKSIQMTDLNDFGCNIDNKFFSFPNPSPFTLTLGSIHEVAMRFASKHSFHIHVQPYQIVRFLLNAFIPFLFTLSLTRTIKKIIQVNLSQDMLANPVTGSFTNYFKSGDFHDSLYLPMLGWDTDVKLRFNPGGGVFTGYAVAHCHLLPHVRR